MRLGERSMRGWRLGASCRRYCPQEQLHKSQLPAPRSTTQPPPNCVPARLPSPHLCDCCLRCLGIALRLLPQPHIQQRVEGVVALLVSASRLQDGVWLRAGAEAFIGCAHHRARVPPHLQQKQARGGGLLCFECRQPLTSSRHAEGEQACPWPENATAGGSNRQQQHAASPAAPLASRNWLRALSAPSSWASHKKVQMLSSVSLGLTATSSRNCAAGTAGAAGTADEWWVVGSACCQAFAWAARQPGRGRTGRRAGRRARCRQVFLPHPPHLLGSLCELPKVVQAQTPLPKVGPHGGARRHSGVKVSHRPLHVILHGGECMQGECVVGGWVGGRVGGWAGGCLPGCAAGWMCMMQLLGACGAPQGPKILASHLSKLVHALPH